MTCTVEINDLDSTGTATTVSYVERGEGHPFLVLHGGGGPQTVTGFADLLAGERPAHVITPIHPGFSGTPRPDTFTTIGQLAQLYIALLDRLDLNDVTVVGNSIGGWIAAEMAALDTARISSIELVDAVGIEVPGHPVVDFFALTFPEIAQRSYYEPDRFLIDPSTMTPQQQAAMAGNRTALSVYAGDTAMMDVSLRARLSGVAVPALCCLGRPRPHRRPGLRSRLRRRHPDAEFVLLTETGHMPQLETPKRLVPVVWDFAHAHARNRR